MSNIVECRSLGFNYGKGNSKTSVLKNLNFKIRSNEKIAIIGQSGCGKSTLARVITQLYQADAGKINYLSRNIRKNIQMIFQDPFASLNPRLTVGDIVAEPLVIQKIGSQAERQNKVAKMLELVGLQQTDSARYPHQFSGGQRQRIAIARAIISEPELIIADEPLSALDVSIQSQILNLLMKLKIEQKLTYLFISHDLASVEHIADRVIVMYLGQIIESGDSAQIFDNSRHPYTQALISAAPTIGKGKRHKGVFIQGEPASPLSPPSGCSYHPRCPKMAESCAYSVPTLESINKNDDSHLVACPVQAEPSV